MTRPSGLENGENARSEAFSGRSPDGAAAAVGSASPGAFARSARFLADRAPRQAPPGNLADRRETALKSAVGCAGAHRATTIASCQLPTPARARAAAPPRSPPCSCSPSPCSRSRAAAPPPRPAAPPTPRAWSRPPRRCTLGAVVRPSGSLKSERERRREDAHPPARLLRPPGLRAAGARHPARSTYSHDLAPWLGTNAGIFLSSLSTSAATTTQLQQLLGEVLQSGASATTPSAWPFASGRAGRDRARHERRFEGRLVHLDEAQHAGAHAASYRGVRLPGDLQRRGLRDRRPPRRARHRHGPAQRDRHLARRPLARARSRLREAARQRPRRRARARLLEPRRRRRRQRWIVAWSGRHLRQRRLIRGKCGTAGTGTQGLGGLVGLLGGARTVNVSLVPSSNSIALDVDSLASGSSSSSGSSAAAAAAAVWPAPPRPAPRRSANCRANRGSPPASAMSAPRSAGDVQALHGLGSLISSLGSSSGAAPQRRKLAAASTSRACSKGSSPRCRRSAPPAPRASTTSSAG